MKKFLSLFFIFTFFCSGVYGAGEYEEIFEEIVVEDEEADERAAQRAAKEEARTKKRFADAEAKYRGLVRLEDATDASTHIYVEIDAPQYDCYARLEKEEIDAFFKAHPDATLVINVFDERPERDSFSRENQHYLKLNNRDIPNSVKRLVVLNTQADIHLASKFQESFAILPKNQTITHLTLDLPALKRSGHGLVREWGALTHLTLNLPALTDAGYCMGYLCPKLKCVDAYLPELEYIFSGFFNDCPALESVDFSLPKFGQMSGGFLENCTSLKRVSLSLPALWLMNKDVKFLKGCPELVYAHIMAPQLKRVYGTMFEGCDKLTAVMVDGPSGEEEPVSLEIFLAHPSSPLAVKREAEAEESRRWEKAHREWLRIYVYDGYCG